MSDLERCELCGGKLTYPTYQWAQHDAHELNRKKRRTGHMHVYRGPCGHWHVGRHDDLARKVARSRPRRRWNWRVWLNRKGTP